MSTATHPSAAFEATIASAVGPYGFAVAYRARDVAVPLRPPLASRNVQHSSTTGVELVVRHYGDTPESLGDVLPLTTGGCLLVYEGRVDNRGEVARALDRPSLADASDGTVLAAAYEHWGARLSCATAARITRARRRLKSPFP